MGKILARIIGDVSFLGKLFHNSVTTLVPEIVKLLAIMVIMLSMNIKLALISFITLPFFIISIFMIQISSRKRWQLFIIKNSNLNAYIHEVLSGIKVVQGFNGEKITSREFMKMAGEHRDAFVKAVRISDLFWPMVEISGGIGIGFVMWFGIKMLDTGEITVGLMVAFMNYISMFWSPIRNISNFYNLLITNMSAAERVFEVLDIEPEIYDSSEAYPILPVEGNVEFRNVTFWYEKNNPVLRNINFKVKAGQTIALVGPTGVGKTTVVNLIGRFYDTCEGEILIDGHNV